MKVTVVRVERDKRFLRWRVLLPIQMAEKTFDLEQRDTQKFSTISTNTLVVHLLAAVGLVSSSHQALPVCLIKITPVCRCVERLIWDWEGWEWCQVHKLLTRQSDTSEKRLVTLETPPKDCEWENLLLSCGCVSCIFFLDSLPRPGTSLGSPVMTKGLVVRTDFL